MSHAANQARAHLVAALAAQAMLRAHAACDLAIATDPRAALAAELRAELVNPERLDALDPGRLPHVAIYRGALVLTVVSPHWPTGRMLARILEALAEQSSLPRPSDN